MTDAYLPPGTRPFTVDELADMVRGGRLPTRPEQWTQGWLAKLAPIGEVDGTGLRMLSAGGQWSVRDGAPVVDVDADQTPVGHITRVWVEDWALMAAGVIDPAVDLTEVKPQVDLIRFETMMGGADQNVIIFRSAEVAAIYLGPTPAFPSVWIRHDREAGR